uniref:Uncharacterized protein n=1 Tax=Rhizophora mucronata TaxID=61149 RepID=A0A2P2R2F8_RHIMU
MPITFSSPCFNSRINHCLSISVLNKLELYMIN